MTAHLYGLLKYKHRIRYLYFDTIKINEKYLTFNFV